VPGRERAHLQELAPTAHPALPANPGDFWLVPAADDPEARTVPAHRALIDGVAKYRAGDYAAALPLLSRPSLATVELADYARYYEGLAKLRLSRGAEARQAFDDLMSRKPGGHLALATALAAGEAAQADGDHAAAVRLYEQLAADKTTLSDDVLSRLGNAALAAGDRRKAAEAFLRVYYEYPLTDAATTAGSQLASLQDQISRTGYKADLGRAQQLFGARRYAEAQDAFQKLQGQVSGDERELVDLRVAECNFYLKRYAAARDGLRPYMENASRKAEARFFYSSALRELGNEEQFLTETRALIEQFPDSSWAEEALNNLGTFHIVKNDDDQAAKVFGELFAKFPKGARAERAAWKYGWDAYKKENYAETVRVFETAAALFPRSDYRPPWLYWSARAHEKLGDIANSTSRLRLIYTDYANSYYGRLAERILTKRAGAFRAADHLVPVTYKPVAARAPLPNESRIRLLLANGLYDDALNELRYAQRVTGNSSVIDATMAWAYHRKGELRRAITLMRRAYPHFLTATQKLPTEIMQVIFPLTYWDAVRKYSAQHGLDPYIVAALILQESTFDPEAKSVANAYGLMQIVPATGRSLARSLGIRRFSTPMLMNGEMNIRLGTLYFSRLVEQMGGVHYALASYNAGENRIVRWKAERPGIDQEEFIDDIPFPETQNYVKRILGIAEDYRQLYGSGGGRPQPIIVADADGNPAAGLPKTTTRKPTTTRSTAKRTAKPSARKPATKKPPVKKPPVKKAAPTTSRRRAR
jgi:peptidoglycan lytic transglycosylase